MVCQINQPQHPWAHLSSLDISILFTGSQVLFAQIVDFQAVFRRQVQCSQAMGCVNKFVSSGIFKFQIYIAHLQEKRESHQDGTVLTVIQTHTMHGQYWGTWGRWVGPTRLHLFLGVNETTTGYSAMSSAFLNDAGEASQVRLDDNATLSMCGPWFLWWLCQLRTFSSASSAARLRGLSVRRWGSEIRESPVGERELYPTNLRICTCADSQASRVALGDALCGIFVCQASRWLGAKVGWKTTILSGFSLPWVTFLLKIKF